MSERVGGGSHIFRPPITVSPCSDFQPLLLWRSSPCLLPGLVNHVGPVGPAKMKVPPSARLCCTTALNVTPPPHQIHRAIFCAPESTLYHPKPTLFLYPKSTNICEDIPDHNVEFVHFGGGFNRTDTPLVAPPYPCLCDVEAEKKGIQLTSKGF